MKIIVGLGNPGKKYKNTRHNIGFRVLDKFQKENNFPDFKIVKKFKSLISEEKIGNKKVVLAKPQTFMNKSGQTVKALATFYKITLPGSVIIVHDDIDLPLGKIRISKGRGSAGHKGVESIIKILNSKDFIRIRIGIAQENQRLKYGTKQTDKFVLEKFTEKEGEVLRGVIKTTCQALKTALTEGTEKAMIEFNR